MMPILSEVINEAFIVVLLCREGSEVGGVSVASSMGRMQVWGIVRTTRLVYNEPEW